MDGAADAPDDEEKMMNTKLLLASSAIFMGVLGVAGTFSPQEVAAAAGVPPAPLVALFLQIAGALSLGAAAQNWTEKHAAIGGIYNRPLALANLIHFLVVAIALLRLVAAGERGAVILVLTAFYALFALAFAMVTFGASPVKSG